MKKFPRSLVLLTMLSILLIVSSAPAIAMGTINRSHVYMQWIHYIYHDKLTGVVETDNIGLQQQVAVIYRVNKGPWQTVQAAKAPVTDNNRLVWKFSQAIAESKPTIDVFFRFIADGSYYYDDNNGAYFTVGSVETAASPWALGQKNVVLAGADAEAQFDNPYTFNGSIVTRHFNNNQTVQVVYTLDNWAHQSTINLSAPNTETNNPDLQKWHFYKTLYGYYSDDFLDIKFKVVYTNHFYFNNIPLTATYTDDNFGKNYEIINTGKINNWTPAFDIYD